MGDFDVAAKVLLQEVPEDVARLALGDDAVIVGLGAEDAVIPGVERRLDKLLRIELEGKRELRLHVEVEARPSAAARKRTFRYWSQVHEHHDEVLSLVIYLQPGNKQGYPSGSYTRRVLGREVITFSFEVVRMWELEAEALLRDRVLGLLPLLPFARGARKEHVHRAMETLARAEPRRKGAELQAALAMVAGHVFPTTNWLATIPEEVLMASTTFEAIRAQGRREGRQEGRAEGRAEGRQEGRAEGRQEGRTEGRQEGRTEAGRDALREILAARFGDVPGDVGEALTRIQDPEVCKALVRSAAVASSLEEFRSALPPTE